MKFKLKSAIGFSALTIGHIHPDILPQTKVLITGVKDDGYVVKVHGRWMVAGSDNGATITKTREVWFPSDNLELIP